MDDAEEMEKMMGGIHYQWYQYIDMITTTPISYYYHLDINRECKDIKEMTVFFRNCNIYLNKNRELSNKYDEKGIMSKFFAILICHKFLCEDVELEKIDELKIEEFDMPTQKYENKFCSLFLVGYKRENIEHIEEYLEDIEKTIDPIEKEMIDLIFEEDNKKFCFEERKKYRYVLKKVDKVIKWIIEYKNFIGIDSKKKDFIKKMLNLTDDEGWDENEQKGVEKLLEWYGRRLDPYIFEDSVDETRMDPSDWTVRADLLIAIIQEIYYIKYEKEKEIIPNLYYGYNNKGQTLNAILENKDADSNHALTIVTLIKRIELRYLVNLGYAEVIKEKRKLHKMLLELKKRLYFYDNWNDYMGENLFFLDLVRYVIERFKYNVQVDNNH